MANAQSPINDGAFAILRTTYLYIITFLKIRFLKLIEVENC